MFFFQMPLAEMVTCRRRLRPDRHRCGGTGPPASNRAAGHLGAVKETLASPGSLDAALSYYRHLLNPARHDPRLAAVEAAANGYVPVPGLYLHGADDGCIGTDVFALDEEMKALYPAGLEARDPPGPRATSCTWRTRPG